MKKIIVMLLICILTLSFIAQAETSQVDFNPDDYTENELIDIRNAINKKIEHEFPYGNYLCGEDIKPGQYIIKVVEYIDADGYTHTDEGWILVIESKEAYEKAINSQATDASQIEGLLMDERIQVGQSIHINLKEGNYLILQKAYYTIKINNEIWKPE